MRTLEEILEGLQGESAAADPIPHPLPALAPIFHALARMGRDANGSLLHSERTSWLDENKVRDPEERELFHSLFDAAESARAEAHAELHEEALSAHRHG